MSLSFNAREIFSMGVEIEANVKAFYEEAARKSAETAMRDLLRELAAWEAQHVSLFQSLMDGLPSKAGAADIFDPDGEAETYLRAMGDSHVFVRNRDVARLVAGCATPLDIIDLALSFEKDSVVFYTAMRKVVAANLGREKIDTLIDEELKHIGVLTQRRQAISARA